MTDSLAATLQTVFGFSSFRLGQEDAIRSILGGHDTLVVMPTGAGKSLVYQLSALRRPGVTLVISPLIALMKDQVDSLVRRSIPAAYINSTLSSDQQRQCLRDMAMGNVRLVYVAPERLRHVRFMQALQQVTVGLLAVDEAHCISQWGHDFRPDYLHIAGTRQKLGYPVTAALTATATPQVQDDIIRQLGLNNVGRVVTGFNRPNLCLEVRYAKDDASKLRELALLLGNLQDGAAIIYAGTRRSAEEVAEFIHHVGIRSAAYYHAGMDPDIRARVQEAFLAGDTPVVVATNAFGMGIDRSDVRMVIHYDMPGTLDAYYQEAGRAGRDGDPARAILIYSPRDRALQEWFIENSTPAPADLSAIFGALHPGAGKEVRISRDKLTLATGIDELGLRLGLAQLERAGVIEYLGDDGRDMMLRPGTWDPVSVQAAAAAAQQQIRHRSEQLESMIAYAEANACRRRILLEHFGDHSPAEAEACCDNCLAVRLRGDDVTHSTILSEADVTALVILDAVRRLPWGVGTERLAQMLAGSKAKAMSRVHYDANVYYGRLAEFGATELEKMIAQLISLGHLKSVGSKRPVLRLTPLGLDAVRQRRHIPLALPGSASAQRRSDKKAARQAGDTVKLSLSLYEQGLSPQSIASQRALSMETIYNHLARGIAAGSVSLAKIVPAETQSSILTAIEQVGSTERLAPLKAMLSTDISYGEIRCVVEAWKKERGCVPTVRPDVQADAVTPGADVVAEFLATPHPRPLLGPWSEGWALGFHSGFGGADWTRSAVGDLTYRLKYQADSNALQPLVEQALVVCREHARLCGVDALVAIPPSEQHPVDHVAAFCASLASALGKSVLPALAKTRKTLPQKDMHTITHKRANVAGAFSVVADIRGKKLLVVDDLLDSGETLKEATRVLELAGAKEVSVLTLTRTIHSAG